MAWYRAQALARAVTRWAAAHRAPGSGAAATRSTRARWRCRPDARSRIARRRRRRARPRARAVSAAASAGYERGVRQVRPTTSWSTPARRSGSRRCSCRRTRRCTRPAAPGRRRRRRSPGAARALVVGAAVPPSMLCCSRARIGDRARRRARHARRASSLALATLDIPARDRRLRRHVLAGDTRLLGGASRSHGRAAAVGGLLACRSSLPASTRGLAVTTEFAAGARRDFVIGLYAAALVGPRAALARVRAGGLVGARSRSWSKTVGVGSVPRSSYASAVVRDAPSGVGCRRQLDAGTLRRPRPRVSRATRHRRPAALFQRSTSASASASPGSLASRRRRSRRRDRRSRRRSTSCSLLTRRWHRRGLVLPRSTPPGRRYSATWRPVRDCRSLVDARSALGRRRRGSPRAWRSARRHGRRPASRRGRSLAVSARPSRRPAHPPRPRPHGAHATSILDRPRSPRSRVRPRRRRRRRAVTLSRSRHGRGASATTCSARGRDARAARTQERRALLRWTPIARRRRVAAYIDRPPAAGGRTASSSPSAHAASRRRHGRGQPPGDVERG